MPTMLRREFVFAALAAVINVKKSSALQTAIPNSMTYFGGRSEGETTDTQALQRAIDTAHKRGGGTAYIPAGRYVTGSLMLRSNVSLWLDNGVTLVMSSDPKDFLLPEKLSYDPKADKTTSNFHTALLVGDSVESIAIWGEGVIDCNRTKGGGPKAIALRRCNHIDIRGITIKNAPSYNISLLGCEFVRLDGITIQNGFSDGIDPDCSRFVRISNCFVESVDDAICLKASDSLGEQRSTEYVTVDNCVLRTASIHFKCGTESCGDFRNIALTNCVFQGGMGMRHGNPGIALYTVDGGALENIVISNIVMSEVGTPLTILRGNRDRCGLGRGPGHIKSIRIANVVASGAKLPSVIAGLSDAPVCGIEIEGFSVAMARASVGQQPLDMIPEKPRQYPDPTMFGTLPVFGIFMRHVSNIVLRDVRLKAAPEEGHPAIIADDATDLQLIGHTDVTKINGFYLWFRNVRDSTVESIGVVPIPDRSYRVSGANTKNLYFKASGALNLDRIVEQDADVTTDAVHRQ